MGILLLAATAANFFEYRVKQDFLIFAHTSCDPSTTTCFAADCDPDTDSECDQTPYTKVSIAANTAPGCILENNCIDFSCNTYPNCTMISCSEDKLDNGETCTSSSLTE